MSGEMTQAFSGQASTGTSAVYKVAALRSGDGDWSGSGVYLSVILSDLNGGTVALEFGPTQSGPWETSEDSTFTADGKYTAAVSNKEYVRFNLTEVGAGSPATDLKAWIG